jgi:hypothetical protein
MYKILGQAMSDANTAVDLYTVPSGNSAVVSTLSICNQADSDGVFSVAIRPDGATIANEHYIAFDTPIDINDSIFLTVGLTLGDGDVVTVTAESSSISFGLFGSEL